MFLLYIAIGFVVSSAIAFRNRTFQLVKYLIRIAVWPVCVFTRLNWLFKTYKW